MQKPPKISILIPSRNEEHHLHHTLGSLDNLVFPRERMEVILGNDDSNDSTQEILEMYAKGKPWVKILHIKESSHKNGLIGKTRVLAELAKQATGDYFFFTDADILLHPNWINGMLAEFEAETSIGVVVGVTGFKDDRVWPAVQGIEWFMALTLFKIGSEMGFSSTGMGNNMAVSKKAYETIGGYETIGFNIVEDFHLYDQIIKAGFGFKHAFKPDVVAFTFPPAKYFEQRRRWIKGALENKPSGMATGMLQAFCIPLLIILGFINPILSFSMMGVLILNYASLILFFENRLGVKGYLKWLPAFTIYISVAWLLQFMYFIFKKKTVWKGREY